MSDESWKTETKQQAASTAAATVVAAASVVAAIEAPSPATVTTAIGSVGTAATEMSRLSTAIDNDPVASAQCETLAKDFDEMQSQGWFSWF